MASCDALRGRSSGLRGHLGDVGIGLGNEVGRQFAMRAAGQFGCFARVLAGVLVEQLFPLGLAQRAGAVGAPAVVDRLRDLERAVFPAQLLAGGFQLVLAQRAPWLDSLPALFGEPKPMVVRQQIRVGLSLCDSAASMPALMLSGSWPSTSRTTFQP
jgi:hypothetical protein